MKQILKPEQWHRGQRGTVSLGHTPGTQLRLRLCSTCTDFWLPALECGQPNFKPEALQRVGSPESDLSSGLQTVPMSTQPVQLSQNIGSTSVCLVAQLCCYLTVTVSREANLLRYVFYNQLPYGPPSLYTSQGLSGNINSHFII